MQRLTAIAGCQATGIHKVKFLARGNPPHRWSKYLTVASAATKRVPISRAVTLLMVALTAIGVGCSSTQAACEAYPQFNPLTGRTTNEAWEADRFVDSVGVNLHSWGDYVSEFSSKVKPRLLESGIRVIRTNLGKGTFSSPDQVRQLGEAGIRMTLTTDQKTDVSKIVGTIKSLGPQYVFAVEGYNEPESRYGCDQQSSCWVDPTREHQARLYAAIKGDPATRDILVLGPALKGNNLKFSPSALGSIDSIMDGHNMHRYRTDNAYPEQTGSNGYLGQLLNHFRYVGSASKPAFLTETGYSTNAFGTTEAADAVYMPRILLYNFNFGLALTAKYELLDEANQSGDGSFQGNFGYIRSNNTEKPAFTAVKNLIAVLADRGPRFRPASLAYGLSGNTASIYKVLLQKRDGTFYLAMWVAQPIEKVLPQAVTVTVPPAIRGGAIVRPNEGTGWRDVLVSGGQINLILDDKVTIVRLGGSNKPAPC